MSAAVLSASAAHAVSLDVRTDVEAWSGRYDRLEVHRSTLGEGGPYEELTAPTYEPAVLPLTAGRPPASGVPPTRPLALDGRDLVLRVQRAAELRILFSGVDPITNQAAAGQITAQGSTYVTAYADVLGQVVLRTVLQGAAAFLEVLSGSAVPSLGLQAGQAVSGRDPRLPLQHQQTRYLFTDPYGLPSYTYKTRFSNSRTGIFSPFSDPIPGAGVAAVPSALLVIGFVRLVTPDGRPQANRRVTAFHDFQGAVVGGYTVDGASQEARTDKDGRAELTLLRGLVIHVAVEGTALARRIVVPTDPDVLSFDLFDPAIGTDDLFTVQKQSLPYAERGRG